MEVILIKPVKKLGKASGLLESMGIYPRATVNNLKEHYIEELQNPCFLNSNGKLNVIYEIIYKP